MTTSLILQFLHLNDNAKREDPLLKNLQKAYNPGKEVSLGDSIIGFKGKLSFLLYMPKKPTKWGMKAFVLADSKTGYTYN